VCFSPQGDLAAGVVVTAVGVGAVAHLRGRAYYIPAAALPLFLGLHQIDESLVWFGLQGHVSADVGRVAMWIYLAFALVVLPVYAPVAVAMMEPVARRRSAMFGCALLGVVVAGFLAVTMIEHGATATIGTYHIAYSIDLRNAIPVIGAYIVATCLPLLLSSYRHTVAFGACNVVAVVVLARLCADGFTSLWCAYAAVLSAVIVLHMRYAKTPARAGAADTPLLAT
jgi:hypothetical protein